MDIGALSQTGFPPPRPHGFGAVTSVFSFQSAVSLLRIMWTWLFLRKKIPFPASDIPSGTLFFQEVTFLTPGDSVCGGVCVYPLNRFPAFVGFGGEGRLRPICLWAPQGLPCPADLFSAPPLPSHRDNEGAWKAPRSTPLPPSPLKCES